MSRLLTCRIFQDLEPPPLLQLLESNGTSPLENSRPCLKQQLRRKYHFRYIVDALRALDDHDELIRTPLFAYSWFGESRSRDDEGSREILDANLYEFLQEMNETGFLKDTAIVFLAGGSAEDLRSPISSGKSRKLSPVLTLSSVEYLMSGAFMWFPPQFAEEHSDKMNALRSNSVNLVNAFDLHATLLDLIDIEKADTTEEAGRRVGYSLLNSIVPERTCSEAEIPLEFCACFERLQIDVEGQLARSFSQAVVQRANSEYSVNGTKWELVEINDMVRFSQQSNWTDIFKTSIRVIPAAEIEALARFSWKEKEWIFLSDLSIAKQLTS